MSLKTSSLNPSAKGRTWTKPEIVYKSAASDAQHGSNLQVIDGFPPLSLGTQLSS
jgi:hypothetical protein